MKLKLTNTPMKNTTAWRRVQSDHKLTADAKGGVCHRIPCASCREVGGRFEHVIRQGTRPAQGDLLAYAQFQPVTGDVWTRNREVLEKRLHGVLNGNSDGTGQRAIIPHRPYQLIIHEEGHVGPLKLGTYQIPRLQLQRGVLGE